MKKQYIISGDRLLELLSQELALHVLERDGVDNWEWYMEGKRNILSEIAQMNNIEVYDESYIEFEEIAANFIEDFEQLEVENGEN